MVLVKPLKIQNENESIKEQELIQNEKIAQMIELMYQQNQQQNNNMTRNQQQLKQLFINKFDLLNEKLAITQQQLKQYKLNYENLNLLHEQQQIKLKDMEGQLNKAIDRNYILELNYIQIQNEMQKQNQKISQLEQLHVKENENEIIKVNKEALNLQNQDEFSINPQLIKELKGHNSITFDIKQISENKFLTSHYNGQVNEWDQSNGNFHTLIKSFNPVYCMVVLSQNGHYLIGNCQKIQEFDQNGINIKNMIGHKDNVNKIIQKNESTFISASNDKTIKFWDIQSGQCIRTLIGHKSCIKDLLFYKEHLISCSKDSSIRIWNEQSNDALLHLIHNGEVTSIIIQSKKLVSGSTNKTIKIWDEEFNFLRDLTNNSIIYELLSLPSNHFVSRDQNSIKIWDFYGCIKVFDQSTQWISKLILTKDLKLISSHNDNSISIWTVYE